MRRKGEILGGIFLAAALVLILSYGVQAAGPKIGVVVGNNKNSIYILNAALNTLSGPQLSHQMGSEGGGLFDVVITSDGKTAIVSNFGDSTIYFIDITNPALPLKAGKTEIGFFAEDMALAPNGKFVLVTDGGFSSRIAIVNIQTHELVGTKITGSKYSNAIDITPDGRTVITADYFAAKLHYFLFDKVVGALYYKGSLDLLYPDPDVILPPIWDPTDRFSTRPVNVTINHDGKTALANIAGSDLLATLQILSPGVVKLKEFFFASDYRKDPRYKNGKDNELNVNGTQSTAFTWTNNKAYVCLQMTDLTMPDPSARRTEIVELSVAGPGKVMPTGVLIPVTHGRGTSQLFGVDCMAIEPGSHFLYFGNPTVSGGRTLVTVVDLWKKLQKCNLFLQPGEVSTGVAFRVQ